MAAPGPLRHWRRLVQPIGMGGAERVVAFRKSGGELTEEEQLTAARFVPVIGAHGLANP